MRIVCCRWGPAGLYFGLLTKKLHPEHAITVVERNKPYDTFGWGVVFSDATMAAMRVWDPETAAEIEDAFNHWDDIEVLFKGTRQRTSGHGFVGIGRKKLLNILQRRCERLGVELAFSQEVDSDLEFPDADLVVASDGLNSKFRNRYADAFQPDLVVRPNRYIWLGTKKLFDAFTFDFRRTEHGWFQAHIYKFDAETSTFIVETTEEAYEAHGLGQLDQQASIEFCEKLFAEVLDSALLMTNAKHLRGSAWLNFTRLVCGKWSHFNGASHVVLMGDAATLRISRSVQERSSRSTTPSSSPDNSRRTVIGKRRFRRFSPTMRKCGGSMSRASRTLRATRWNGSRWLAGVMPINSSPSSSCIPC